MKKIVCIHTKITFSSKNIFLKIADGHKKSGDILRFNAFISVYSTVTDFAKFRGWSTLQPRITAI